MTWKYKTEKERKEARKQSWRKYNEKNKEIIRQKNKENYYKKRDYYLAYGKDPLRRIDNNSRGKARRIMENSGLKKFCSKCYLKQKIQVHHLDKNPLNNVIENLIYLCIDCHRKEHRL